MIPTQAVVSVNGRITPAAEAVVSVFDHGFLYGEGIYETLRTYRREPFLFERHMHRLRDSAARLSLPAPGSDADLRARVSETMAALAGPPEAYIRVLFTRGAGELSYSLTACPAPTLVIIVKPFTPPPERTFTEGIAVSLVGIRRNHPNALDPMIKSNNLLNNALAMQEANRHGAEEALMQNLAGELAECSQSNFFLVSKGRVLTPPLSAGLLPGLTREFVMELCPGAGIECREISLRPADLATADEAFITGTTREVTPVVRVDDRLIGDGRPGPITRRLLEHFRAQVAAGGIT
jgi:branched-chain amino acid aminotransferase